MSAQAAAAVCTCKRRAQMITHEYTVQRKDMFALSLGKPAMLWVHVLFMRRWLPALRLVFPFADVVPFAPSVAVPFLPPRPPPPPAAGVHERLPEERVQRRLQPARAGQAGRAARAGGPVQPAGGAGAGGRAYGTDDALICVPGV